MKKTRSKTPGISRIDQAEKRTHGFFVRVTRNGKTFSAFCADQTYGGKGKAFRAAQKAHAKLVRKHGKMSRRKRASIERRASKSGIVGVRKIVVTRRFWVAHWSPRPYVVRQKLFSIDKLGDAKAKALAIKARDKGLRNMLDR